MKRLDEGKLQSSLIEVIQHEATPSRFAVVLAIGEVDPQIEVGMQVITKPFSGAPCEVLLDGVYTEAHILMEDDILATEVTQ